ncbi:epsin-1 isoform X4 [Drosophila ananassae]|uniref:epsin-1 isoform X4 n=1 Tax=Drosophila ananassae TaxID=7217 RepID=UPI001CFFD4FF|nr:epsin-1 isoform X4 [Drosophila ananassae]
MRKQKDDMQVNVAGLRRNIKNLAHNYSDAQVKVREATSNDPWGPSAAIMGEIADLTHNVVAFSEIMQMIWKRLNDHGKNWRHVYKALILLEYLIKTGSEKVAQQCKENIFAIQTLRDFVYFEEGKDQGTHVREKAKQLVNLLKDDERLKNERVKALKAKERFAQHPSGFGSDGYIDGPSQRDLPPGWQEEPPKSVSELEMVRPQTAGEEELQLQLAMAMSREEAEQEEAKRRSDDVRLQLALSQSEQDFKDGSGRPIPAPAKREEPQSHLMDLLDISLGATSISSPPLGAAGGAPAGVIDPWATSAPRAPSQLSDPWSGTSSPQVDPWHPSAAPRTIMSAGVPMNAPPGANDAWGVRTQSPSVASGSSTEGWLQSNGNANQNGRGPTPAGAPVEAIGWLAKTNAPGALGAAPVNNGTNNGSASGDPWLAEAASGGAAAIAPADPWAGGGAQAGAAALDDPWKALGTGAVKKPSPEFDEFDLITNRNKSELSNYNASNNNNASLLDDMDPLSTNYGNGTGTGISSVHPSTGATAKKPLKDPHSFLGENSALVNLDNLIKPAGAQTQAGTAPAYNPFSDTVIPPKTNLFQQQQPAVPSINQLKQQAPFAVNMNQDPWAPVMGGVSATNQPGSQVYNYPYASSDANINNNNGISSNINSNINTTTNRVHEFVSPSPGIDSIRNMDIFSDRSYFNSPTAPADDNLFYSGGSDNNNFGQTHRNYGASGLYSSYAASYSSALSDSLAETPGVSVAPIGFVPDPVQSFGPTSSSAAHCKLEPTMEAWTLK